MDTNGIQQKKSLPECASAENYIGFVIQRPVIRRFLGIHVYRAVCIIELLRVTSVIVVIMWVIHMCVCSPCVDMWMFHVGHVGF